jgi:hypothetical protein
MPTNPENPAFPGALNQNLTGLTKREYFAAQALQGILANGGNNYAATEAVQLADEVIAQLNASKKPVTQGPQTSTPTRRQTPPSPVNKAESYDTTI